MSILLKDYDYPAHELAGPTARLKMILDRSRTTASAYTGDMYFQFHDVHVERRNGITTVDVEAMREFDMAFHLATATWARAAASDRKSIANLASPLPHELRCELALMLVPCFSVSKGWMVQRKSAARAFAMRVPASAPLVVSRAEFGFVQRLVEEAWGARRPLEEGDSAAMQES